MEIKRTNFQKLSIVFLIHPSTDKKLFEALWTAEIDHNARAQ